MRSVRYERTRSTMKPGSRYTTGEQPCQNLLRGDADIMALGEGNRRNVHQCPVCEGNRTWCENCHADHHDGGWETCKPGAYAEPDRRVGGGGYGNTLPSGFAPYRGGK